MKRFILFTISIIGIILVGLVIISQNKVIGSDNIVI